MMKIEINVEDYFSSGELKELVEDEVGGYVRRMVERYFQHRSYDDFVKEVATKAYWDAVGKLGEDTMGKVRRKVRELIPEISVYSLTGYTYANGRDVKTRLQKIIDEESEKMRPEIAERIRESYKHAIDSDGPGIVAGTVEDMLINALRVMRDA